MRRYILIIFSLLLAVSSYTQTDANSGHFWADRSTFSPAYLVPMLHASVLCRTQQTSFKGQPITGWIKFSKYKPKWRSQFGGQVHYDRAGYTNTTKADFNYIFSLGTDENRVNLGLLAGVGIQAYDESKIKADDMNDAYLYDLSRAVVPNFNFGAEWVHKVNGRFAESDEFTLGLSAINMEDWLTRMDRQVTIASFWLYSSYRYRTMKALDLYGGIKLQHYDMNRMNGEVHFALIKTKHDDGNLETLDVWNVGLSYRHNFIGHGANDMLVNAGVKILKRMYLGYCFDLVVRDDLAKPFSTHEIFLEYKFKDRRCMAEKNTYILLGGK